MKFNRSIRIILVAKISRSARANYQEKCEPDDEKQNRRLPTLPLGPIIAIYLFIYFGAAMDKPISLEMIDRGQTILL